MKRAACVLAFLMLSVFAFATTPQLYAPGTLTASCSAVTGAGRCTPLFLNGNSLAIGVTWQVSFDTGTASAVTAQLTGSNDNSSWTVLQTNTACLTTGGAACSQSIGVTSYIYLACNVVTYTKGTTNNLTCSVTSNPTANSAPTNSQEALAGGPYTVAALPSGVAAGTLANVSNGTSGTDCTVGGGTTLVTCQYGGASWAAFVGAVTSGVATVTGDGTLITNSSSAGNVTLTTGSGAAHQFWNGTWHQPAFTDISGTAANAQIPVPTVSALGGIEALASATAHSFVTFVNTSGIQVVAQPAFTDVSGSAACGQLPALIGDATSSAGSCTTSVVKINGTAVPTSALLLGSNGSNVLIAAALASGKVYVGSAGALPVAQSLAQDATLVENGNVTVVGINATLLSGLTTGPLGNTTGTGVPFIYTLSGSGTQLPTTVGPTFTGTVGLASATVLTAFQLTYIATGIQCLHADSSGNVTGTGSDCGAGGGGDSITSPQSTIHVTGSSSASGLDLYGGAGEIMCGATPALAYGCTIGAAGHQGTWVLAGTTSGTVTQTTQAIAGT